MITKYLVERMKPGHLVQHYLLAAYCYYHMHESPLTDEAFDYLCVRLLGMFDSIEHQHKKFIFKGDLEAGTCLLAEDKFPKLVQLSAIEYANKSRTSELYEMLDAALPPLGARPARVMRRPAAPVVAPAVPQTEVPKPAQRIVRRPPAPTAQAATPAPAAPRRIVRSPVKR